MKQHVRVLAIGRPGAVALGIGVGGDAEQAVGARRRDLRVDVAYELRIHVHQRIAAIEE